MVEEIPEPPTYAANSIAVRVVQTKPETFLICAGPHEFRVGLGGAAELYTQLKVLIPTLL